MGAALAVVVCAALVFGGDYLTDGAVRAYARMIGGALGAGMKGITGAATGGFFASRAALVGENERLKDELEKRRQEFSQYDVLKRENETLRGMSRLAQAEGAGLTVPVLSSIHSSPYGTFLIGAGTDDGVGAGSVVLTEGGYVLGAVSEADEDRATVRGIFASDADIDLIAGETAFAAKGRGNGNARAEVPREAPLTVGQLVLAPLYASRPAGVIGRIESASSSAVADVLIRVPVNLDAISFVYVVPRP